MKAITLVESTLRTGPHTALQIAAVTGLSVSSIRKSAHALRDCGAVETASRKLPGRGRYLGRPESVYWLTDHGH